LVAETVADLTVAVDEALVETEAEAEAVLLDEIIENKFL
jgi:hypothetical protein